VAALTIAALFALGIAPALWQHSAAHRSPDTATVADRALTPAVASPDVNVAVRNGAVEPSNAGPVDDQSTEPDARPASFADPVTYSPAFASAGTAMFYHAEAKGHTKLMRADTNRRGDVLRITSVLDDRGRNYHPRPSPDGKQIAFDSDRDGVRGVYVADANGRNVRRVSGSGYAAIPSWSADGRRLAFVRAEEGKPKVWNLWTLDLRSGRSERLTSYKYGQPWGGSWFPDNRRLAYSHETELVILDLGTGRKRVFQSPVKGRLVRTPAVSPDGSHVVFQVYRRGTWLLDMNTGKMRKVLGDPTAEEYAWAPDGRKVAYHSRGGGNWGIWVLNKVGVKIVNTEQ
jgi:Tol biopolymer transport system component